MLDIKISNEDDTNNVNPKYFYLGSELYKLLNGLD